MLSLEQLRKIDEKNQLSDQELLELRDALYPIIEKILDRYFDAGAVPSCTDVLAYTRPFDRMAIKRLDDNQNEQTNYQRDYAGNGEARRFGVCRVATEKWENERMGGERPESAAEAQTRS